MRAISLDLRERILVDFQNGMNFAQLAKKYTVSAEWVRLFIRRFEATGEVAPRPKRVKKKPFHIRYEAELRAAVAEQPDLTLELLRTKLGVKVSVATLHASLVALKITFKKNAKSSRTKST